jgi:hypothetical protein
MVVNPGGHRKSGDNENQRGKKDLLFWNAEFYITEAYSESWAADIDHFGNHALSRYLRSNLPGTKLAVPQERRGPCVEGIGRVSWKLRLQSMSALRRAARGIQQDLKQLHEPRKVIDC